MAWRRPFCSAQRPQPIFDFKAGLFQVPKKFMPVNAQRRSSSSSRIARLFTYVLLNAKVCFSPEASRRVALTLPLHMLLLEKAITLSARLKATRALQLARGAQK
jgi:hypothetical protein